MNLASQSSVFALAGMHRSGTSLTASLLQSMGVDIGQRLVGPTYGNIKGHFENIDFVEFHKQILRSHKLDEQGFTLKPEIPVPDYFVEIAQNIIRQNSHSPVWGWKDPRTTLFLDFWRKLLPNANFIFVYRSPWEVVDSLYRRGTDEILLSKPQLALLAWIHYNRKILEFYDKYTENCLLVNINSIFSEKSEFVKTINQKFNVNLTEPKPEIFAPDLWVDKISQSHRTSWIEKCFPEAVEIYQELNLKALGGDKPSVVGRKYSTLWNFQDWLNIRLLEKKLKILQTELTQWQEQFQDAQVKVVQLETELGTTQGQLNAKETTLQAALAKLVQIETELGTTQGQLNAK
ncbi:sulfotransferase, partial [Microseira wollei]|uniref:sulfotransferase n=1 Tax=Microseira wollei TaxID=467598 RepID=UPI001CFC5E08